VRRHSGRLVILTAVVVLGVTTVALAAFPVTFSGGYVTFKLNRHGRVTYADVGYTCVNQNGEFSAVSHHPSGGVSPSGRLTITFTASAKVKIKVKGTFTSPSTVDGTVTFRGTGQCKARGRSFSATPL
jgi:hypothetical protein